MRWKDHRRSENVDDRRGVSGGAKVAGGGLGAIVIALIGIFVLGKDPSSLLTSGALGGGGAAVESRPLTAAEKEASDFVSTVLAYTEDVWKETYPALAGAYSGAPTRYVEPRLVLFSGEVGSACGNANAAVGPFYCPGDSQVYIDLSFFEELARRFKAPGDFAQAYVVAHEVGHHIQKLLGITRQVDSQRGRVSKEEYNRLSVRLELQADFFAGVWAHHAQRRFDILEPGDLAEGLAAAGAVGDDRLQMQARGYVVPESFTHGTAEQRIRWFRRGFEEGDPRAHDPFQGRYEDL
ncbi:MAG: neutral zinc metallopeptidase [Planctomycetota bacterium]